MGDQDSLLDPSYLDRMADYSGAPWLPNNPYFARAESYMAQLWEGLIWPFIADCDFTSVLDLAAGHGRNSAMLMLHARRLLVMDIQPGNVEICERRFAKNSKVACAANNGYDLQPTTDSAVSLIYCFDAMVHFDSDVVRSYLRDTRRVLMKGGRGFFHHSNYTKGHDWRTNPASRNFMSAELFEHYALKEGLVVVRQKTIGWRGYQEHDCLTLVEKPAT
jgi:SAM-dependent methyltransferase